MNLSDVTDRSVAGLTSEDIGLIAAALRQRATLCRRESKRRQYTGDRFIRIRSILRDQASKAETLAAKVENLDEPQ